MGTSPRQSERTVVVGVDGSPEARVAAQYAVEQAEQRGLNLVLVHAYPLPPMSTPLPGDTFSCLREAGQALLDNLVNELDIPPTVGVSTMLEQTAPVILLQRAAEAARLIVIGQHHSSWLERLMLGSVASPLCSKAVCPVVIVSRTWRSAAGSLPVMVALDGQEAADAALQLAFEEAERCHTGVVALHAVPPECGAATVEEHRQQIQALLADHVRQRPDTSVEVRTLHGDPAGTIAAASRGASLLVLGTPHAKRLGSWTRSVARTVLKHVDCPVAVVPRPRLVTADTDARLVSS
jgi:nucleotide-binding universal stress UspA family protein